MIHIRLYTAGHRPELNQALIQFRMYLERQQGEPCTVETVNVLEHPEKGEADQIYATPTLIKLSPPPAMRVIGNITEPARIARALGLTGGPIPKGKQDTP